MVRDITPNSVLIKTEMDGNYDKRIGDDMKHCKSILCHLNDHKDHDYEEATLEPQNEFHEISEITNDMMNNNSFHLFS